ncbi:MAG: glycoside hydrolase family 47 protein [Bacteroidota bacterium]
MKGDNPFAICGLIMAAVLFLAGCGQKNGENYHPDPAGEVRAETGRCWDAYLEYARGDDVLLPLSRSGTNWYEESLNISPVDAFSSMVVMGLTGKADTILEYVADSVDYVKDFDVKVFEVNIRILGGLVSMYQLSGQKRILEKARDFGDRLLPAFNSPTGIPYFWVNLKTGEVKGSRVNVAEAGTYLLEMGMLSYFTGDPVYYQAAKRSTRAIYERRSEIGLVGEVIDVETGEWINPSSHICAGIDSYYEYLYKGWLLFGDPELKQMWDESIAAVLRYIPEKRDSLTWYGRVDMHTGEHTSSVVTLWDAFMPSLLAVSGHVEEAEELQRTWDWLWNRYGPEPMIYDYRKDSILNPQYDLNPEIIESAWYLWELTGEQRYMDMLQEYWEDLLEYCRTDVAFTALENVITKEKRDYMATYFLAETLKYFYLAFADQQMYTLKTTVFSTEAHPFLKSALDPERVNRHLGLAPWIDRSG